MGMATWIGLGILAWFGLAIVVGFTLARVIRLRDRHGAGSIERAQPAARPAGCTSLWNRITGSFGRP